MDNWYQCMVTEIHQPSKKLLLVGSTASLAPSIVELAQSKGYQVIGTYRTKINTNLILAEWLHLDISKKDSILNFDKLINNHKFDLIIFLPGATNPKRDNLHEYITIHFLNSIQLFEILINKLSVTSQATFIFVSSRAALHPSFDIYYSAIKSGLSAALRSMSSLSKYNGKLLSVCPGLIKESSMYYEMSSENRENHNMRSHGELLSKKELALEIFKIIENKDHYENGEMIEIGPKYK